MCSIEQNVTFDESNFRLTEEKPVTRRREDETTVEVDIGSSGSRASLPAEKPAEVLVERREDVSEQREDPKAVPVAEYQRPIQNRKQVVRKKFRRAN